MGIDDLTNKLKDAVETVKDKASEIVEGRGGLDGIKEDLQEAKDVITGEGSIADKAKGVVNAIKEPGAPDA